MYIFFGAVLLLIVLALDILAVVDCMHGPLTTGMKTLWILLVVFLPALGLLLYYFLGRDLQARRTQHDS